ncbi:uncharacterized protein LOC129770064 [Toxorhynchites rutilus septentrionalis]|uniref:uncharacterized protein LOC129770064 n=1 Tax=Toxorhynchites rutilus septentrionalis TaxID=329112 RepID=UPI0024784E33|nr:uncharacterized protein LOC129770064 [Toxorhynchites rutilus septentrionalis]
MQQEDNTPSEYKMRFLKKYNEMVEQISPEHFDEYNKIAPKYRVFEIYKAGLLDNILSYFNTIWNFTDTDEHLNILDLMKNDHRNDSDKKWRPTGKSVEEQTRPLIVNKLKWQLKYYEKQIEFQKQQLERAVLRVEASRQKWKNLLERRESVKASVTCELNDLRKIESQIIDFEEKIVEDLQR